jgi:hypothetical protein
MKKLTVLCVLSLVGFAPGCAAAQKGNFLSRLFTFKAADKMQVAEKVTGVEKADMKAADAALIGTNLQANKTSVKTDVGGNLTNDSDLMKAYIAANLAQQTQLTEAREQADRRFIVLLSVFIGSLFTLIFRYERHIGKLTSSLLDALDRDNQKDEERLDKALDRKEVKQ